MDNKVCDNCLQLPVVFQTDEGEDAYFIFSWKGDQDFHQLMSDGSLRYGVCLDANPVDARFNYFCCNCIEKFEEEFIDE